MTLDASIIPFPLSAHLVSFWHVVGSEYRYPNNHLSDDYGLHDSRTSKLFRISWIALLIHTLKGSGFH